MAAFMHQFAGTVATLEAGSAVNGPARTPDGANTNAETPPDLDVDGIDTAHKLALVAAVVGALLFANAILNAMAGGLLKRRKLIVQG